MSTVTVIEPHVLLRLGIVQHLTEVLPSLVFEGADYSSLLPSEAPRSTSSDLVLLSVSASENILDLIYAAQRIYAPKSILLLSDSSSLPYSAQNLPPVAAGCILKNSSPDVLTASIKLVLLGGKCFQLPESSACTGTVSKSMPEVVVQSNGSQPSTTWLSDKYNLHHTSYTPTRKKSHPPTRTSTEAEMLNITTRQYEVLVLLARGYPIKTVSRQLNISVATAKAHTETLYQRLDVHNRNEAVYAAVSRGATLGWPLREPANTDKPPTATAA